MKVGLLYRGDHPRGNVEAEIFIGVIAGGIFLVYKNLA
jgi:hypothetical protein